jgi:hypothetical protein
MNISMSKMMNMKRRDFEMNYRSNNIDAVIDEHYNDMESFLMKKIKHFSSI